MPTTVAPVLTDGVVVLNAFSLDDIDPRRRAPAGFLEEGLLRQRGSSSDGRHDMILYARLSTDPAGTLVDERGRT